MEGDRVLKAFSSILAERTRRMDLSARFGGEEFVSVLVDCGIDNADGFAQYVRQRLEEIDFGWGGVTTSAGVVTMADDMDSPHALISAADRALYAAKGRGRNTVCRAEASPVLSNREAGLIPEEGAGDPRGARKHL